MISNTICLIKHLLPVVPVIRKKYVWEFQIFFFSLADILEYNTLQYDFPLLALMSACFTTVALNRTGNLEIFLYINNKTRKV